MTRLQVNTRVVATASPAGTILLDLLRDELDLTATKPGCRTGDCGACLVLLVARDSAEAQPRYGLRAACLTTLGMAEGCQVVTAEGLADGGLADGGLAGDGLAAEGVAGGALGPVHRALRDAGAVQCGYCTPGLVVALTWALLVGEDPEVAAAGTLCRCTGYMGVRRAIEVLRQAGPWAAEQLLPRPIRLAGPALPPLPVEQLPGEQLSVEELPSDELHGVRWLAGGTDLLVDTRHDAPAHRRPTMLARVPELTRIEPVPGGLLIGAAVTVEQLRASREVSARWPELVDHLGLFASPAVRAAATVGGNLAHASPTADLAVPLLALDATVLVRGTAGSREMPLDRFFTAHHRTALQPREQLTGVRVPDLGPTTWLHLERVARRTHDDTAIVSLALRGSQDSGAPLVGMRLAAGGVAPVPLLLPRTAAVLAGRRLDESVVAQALEVLAEEVTPIDDVRGSAQYKRALLGHLLLAALDRYAPGLAARMLAGVPR